MNRTTLWMLATIMFSPLSGCLGGEAPYLHVASPSVGNWAEYLGSDGSRVDVTVVGMTIRYDGAQVPRDVLILEYQIRPAADPRITIVVEEAIDRTTGHQVRHDDRCNPDYGADDRLECGPVNAIYYQASGLPGGLGIGPFWGKGIEPGTIRLETSTPFRDQRIDLIAVEADERGRRCVDLKGDPPAGERLGGWMPMTAIYGPRRICDDDTFPTRWSPDMRFASHLAGSGHPVYELIRMGTRQATHAPEEPLTPPKPDRQPTTDRFAMFSPGRPSDGFDARSAHQVGLMRDEGYAAFSAQGPAVFPYSARYSAGGGTYPGPLHILAPTEEHSHWTLTLVNDTGYAYELTVRQTKQTNFSGTETTRHEVISSGLQQERVKYPGARDDGPVFDPSFVFEYGSMLFDEEVIGAGSSYTARQNRTNGPAIALDDRFLTSVHYLDPAQTGGVVAPWIVQMDSKSGTLTLLWVPPELRLST